MNRHTQVTGRVSMLAVLFVSLAVAACGGEESGGGDSKSSGSGGSGGSGSGGTVICFAYLLVSGNDDCLSQVGTSSGGSTSSTPTVPSSTPIAFRQFDEYEPNNTIANANWVDFPKTTDRDGFIADANVNSASDTADIFAFARTFRRYHAFRLCSHGQKFCNEYGEIDTLTAYIDLLDQSGRVLASTQASSSNYLRVQLAGGVPYYARVVAADTMGARVQYHLLVHEANY